MSCSVRPAIATAVSASISTPVRAVTETVASMRITPVPAAASVSKPKSIVTESSGRMCASGISSLVRLAPAIPAMRAVASTSAFGSPSARTSAMTSAVVVRRPAARRDPAGDGLGADVDHACAAVVVEVGERAHRSTVVDRGADGERRDLGGHDDQHVGGGERGDQVRAGSGHGLDTAVAGAPTAQELPPPRDRRQRRGERERRAERPGGSPAISRSSGATNSSKLSWLLTGLPGKQTTGTSR